jgi:thioredoxin reductase
VDLLVVGAGPVGLACALEASRHALTHVVLEKGALLNTLVNWPTHVVFLTRAEGLFVASTPKGPFPARAAVVATGFFDTPNLLGVPGEELTAHTSRWRSAPPPSARP